MSMTQSLIPESLEDLLYKKEIRLVVSDFQDTFIDPEKYTKAGRVSLGKHVVKKAIKQKRPSIVKSAIDLKRKHKEYPVEDRTRSLVNICAGLPVENVVDFGNKLLEYVNDNIIKLFSVCSNINSEIQRAFITLDDRRVVEPTFSLLEIIGLPIHKYIVNEVVEIGGRLTEDLKSYASGVFYWGGNAIWGAKDKLDAFKALIYPLHPSRVLYINDDDPAEAEIDDYMKRHGGTVIKNYDLGKFIAPILI